jgi:prophage antirepressor-like protein
MHTNYSFDGIPINAIEHDGDLWMTGEDIGRALGYANPRMAIHKLYENNKEELDHYSTVVTLEVGSGVSAEGDEAGNTPPASPDRGTQVGEFDRSGHPASPNKLALRPSQRRRVRIFNEEGVMVITMLSRQPLAAKFRGWAVGLIKSYRRGELVALNAGPAREAVLITCIKEARFGNPVAIDTLIRRYGYPESIRREIRSELQRRANGDPAQPPDLVEWLVESWLPRLREEIEREAQHGAGPILKSIRNRSPAYRHWKETKGPGAAWSLRHRQTDLYTFVCPLAEAEEVELDVTSQRFSRWVTYSAQRLRAAGWERVKTGGANSCEDWFLRLV